MRDEPAAYEPAPLQNLRAGNARTSADSSKVEIVRRLAEPAPGWSPDQHLALVDRILQILERLEDASES
jgi:hypothetical protein